MSNRQLYLDRIRELKQDLEGELQGSKFVKEVEPFMLSEARTNLKYAEKHLNGFLQVDKNRGG